MFEEIDNILAVILTLKLTGWQRFGFLSRSMNINSKNSKLSAVIFGAVNFGAKVIRCFKSTQNWSNYFTPVIKIH